MWHQAEGSGPRGLLPFLDMKSLAGHRPRHAVVADHPGGARRRNARLDVFCPGCGTSRAIDLRTVDRHPLASVGTLVLGLRGAVVSRLSADAEAAWALRAAAGEPSGDDWIGQKQDKAGKREATDQDRPVPDVEAKNSTLRHCGDEL